MSTNTGGPAFPITASTGDPRDGVYCETGMTLLDWMAGQALAGLCSSWYDRHKDDPETQRGHGPALISQSAYTHAEAMLAEKARREATGKDSLQVEDHSPDATKMIPDPFAEDTLRRLAADVLPVDIKDAAKEERLTWCAEQVRARVNTLEAMNKELVEALDTMISGWVDPYDDNDNVAKARAILAKAKEVA